MTTTTSPRPARAVFSTEDFTLLQKAVLSYLQTNEDAPDTVKFSNLYHRLGRMTR